MDTSLAALGHAFVWKGDAKNSNPCSVWIFKDRSDIDKRYQQQQQVRGGHFIAPASCLLSKQLVAVQAAKLPEVIACFCCPSSLRCCSCPSHCPCPQLLAAHPAWDAVLKLRTVLSPAFHLPSASQASSTSPLYCHTVKTQASNLCCHTLTFNLTPPCPYSSPLLLNFTILIPASSASEAPWVKWPDFVAQNDDLGREQVNLLNLRSKVHSDKQIHLSFNNESTLGWINRVKIMILSGGKQGTTKWLSSEHTSYLRFLNFDRPPHCLGL